MDKTKDVQPPVGESKLDFSDTRLAFKHKSDAQLRRTYSLFQKIDSPFLTKIGPPLVSFALKAGLPLEGVIRKTIFDIFCGGISLNDTASRSESLFEAGVRTILDYSVEGEKNEAGFDATRDEIIRTLEHGAKHVEVAFSAMKVTGIANFDLLAKLQSGKELPAEEQERMDKAKARMEAICQRAMELKQPVFVDAEESWVQDTIDQWTEEMMARFNQEGAYIFTTIQFYRKNRLPYLEKLIVDAREKGYFVGVKAVRGAYLEKERDRAKELGYPDPMQVKKADTDADFDQALRIITDHIDVVALCAGTHNEKSCYLLAELIRKKGIDPENRHIIFAQLLGMSDNISFNLAHRGYNAAKYLPYGPVKAVLPYLFRRADENTAIGGQSGRELSLLRKEVRRRRAARK